MKDGLTALLRPLRFGADFFLLAPSSYSQSGLAAWTPSVDFPPCLLKPSKLHRALTVRSYINQDLPESNGVGRRLHIRPSPASIPDDPSAQFDDLHDTMANPPPKRSATGISMRSHIADSHAIVSRLVAATSPPIPKEVNNWRIYFYAVSLCMGAAAYGYDFREFLCFNASC